MSKQASACRYWCMTFNNYSEETTTKLVEWAVASCDYYVIGKEVASTGTKHLQCMFALKEKQRMTGLLNKFKGWAKPHMEPAMAEGTRAAAYCKKGSQSHEEWTEFGTEGPNFGKDADVIEGGTLPDMRRGSASATAKRVIDYAAAIDLAKKRKFDEIDPSILLRYYGNLQRIAADNPPPVTNLNAPCAEWIFGPPGTGKSFTARKENPVFYWKACNKWWCGYKGEEVVIIDDFDKGNRCMGHNLKIWLDEYAFGAEIKGSSMLIRPKKIIITSNYHPGDIWGKTDKEEADIQMIEAISRRVTFRWFSTPYVRPIELPFEEFNPPSPNIISSSPPIPTPPPRDIIPSDSQVIEYFDLTQDY